MNFAQPDFAPAYPEIFLLVMVCVVLLADLAWGEKKPYVAYVLAQFALLGCVLITFATSAPGSFIPSPACSWTTPWPTY